MWRNATAPAATEAEADSAAAGAAAAGTAAADSEANPVACDKPPPRLALVEDEAGEAPLGEGGLAGWAWEESEAWDGMEQRRGGIPWEHEEDGEVEVGATLRSGAPL